VLIRGLLSGGGLLYGGERPPLRQRRRTMKKGIKTTDAEKHNVARNTPSGMKKKQQTSHKSIDSERRDISQATVCWAACGRLLF
jgi:hypothetical protein